MFLNLYISDSTIEENIAFQNSKEINYLLLKEVYASFAF